MAHAADGQGPEARLAKIEAHVGWMKVIGAGIVAALVWLGTRAFESNANLAGVGATLAAHGERLGRIEAALEAHGNSLGRIETLLAQ